MTKYPARLASCMAYAPTDEAAPLTMIGSADISSSDYDPGHYKCRTRIL